MPHWEEKMYMAHFQTEKKVLVTENTIIYTPQLNTKIKHKFNIYIYSTIKNPTSNLKCQVTTKINIDRFIIEKI